MNNPRNLALGAAGVAVVLYAIPGNIFNTPGTQNIGNAWSRGGGSKNHTPAIATKRGSADDEESNQIDAKGIGSKHFSENFADQRPDSTKSGPIGKAWNQAHQGSDEGHRGSSTVSTR